MNKRRKKQQQFEKSDANLIVGHIEKSPISPKQLALTTSDSPYVVQTFKHGLTAEVYRIRLNGQDYTLKKKRPVARVQNLDGQFSFLNEVQRRSDFQKLKDDPQTSEAFRCIVETVYADYRLGIILSDWIEGEPIKKITPLLLSQLFSTLTECEKVGLFEWDLCSGNLLVDSNQKLWLFDFGYMYEFDPLTEFNSDGVNAPLFQFCERFETRFFSGWLLEQGYSHRQSIEIFRYVKQAAVTVLEEKKLWLQRHHADSAISDCVESLRKQYLTALESHEALENLFTVEMFRSHVFDIEDDLNGKSCTSTTIRRVNIVLEMVDNFYPLLQEQDALFFHNEGKSKEELMESYQKKLSLVKQYQL
ncbi:AarF/UbiB family protein [Vibrio cincinnatiensis]|uniref:AarF/UbiB family protein n=1 Tax=Vibrio cincinnatiensis TaxID=675 RepID=UPI001EDDF40C|nr:AarF/UbiB family protein [Vibrio cincinnatiensis]MCG3728896.1 phosphotransferase [Vibrio cincinnatiensis]